MTFLARLRPAPSRTSLPGRTAARLLLALEAAFLLGTVALVFAGRLPAIVLPIRLNPDEAQLGANALRVLRYGSGWASLDSTSSGPLNSLALAWPALLGKPVSLVTVRLTAWMAVSLVFVFSYLAIRRLSGRLNAVLFSLPLAVLFALTDNTEFQHYSSELVSAVLLTASLLLVPLAAEEGCASLPRRSLASGLLLGAVPFAKLQAVPMALLVGAYFAWSLLISRCKNRRKAMALLAVGPVLWPGLYLLPLALRGHLSTFYVSYIQWASLYVKTPLSLFDLHRMIDADGLVSSVVYLVTGLSIAAALLGTSVSSRRAAVLTPAICLAAVFAVVRPGNLFGHYLVLLLPFVAICGGVLSRLTGRWKKAAFLAVYAGMVLLGRRDLEAAVRRRLSETHAFSTTLDFPLRMQGSRLFSWIAGPRSELYVWGWMPQWYLATGLCPATRETTACAEIEASPLQGYYRRRLLEDLRRSSPDLIVDGVKPDSYEYKDGARQGIGSFGELRRFVDDNYSLVSDLGKRAACPDLYVRQDLWSDRMGRIVVPAKVTASATLEGTDGEFTPANLFDSSVTEDSCIDYWLLPDRRAGLVDVALHAPEPIARVMILNTQNGGYAFDRAADLTRVELRVGGNTVASREMRLKRYPDWTAFEFDDATRADALRVTVVSFLGKGGGLNEIKILRR